MLKIPMKKYKNDMLETLSRLIAIPSVKGEAELNMPYGRNVFRALMMMLDRAERLDLESVNLFGHMGYATYGSGSETFAILTHLDVVPAGEGWETDPFQAVIKDGRIYGRGAVDDKGAAVAALYALHAVKNSCISLNKQVKVFFGCDEESGWGDIDYYKAHYPELDYVISPDAFFPIINREKGTLHIRLFRACGVSESGTAILSLQSGSRPNIVPNKARCTLLAPRETIAQMAEVFGEGLPASLRVEGEDGRVEVYCEGKAAHGAHPELGVNALCYLLAFLNILPLSDGAAEQFTYALASKVGLEIDGRTLGIAGSDELSGALSVNLGAMELREDGMEAKLDIRFPISMNTAEIFSKVRDVFAPLGIEAEILHAMEPHYVDENTPFIQSLKRVYEDQFGEEAECCCCAGATYARAFKNSVAFGPVPKDRPDVEHGPNEYMQIDDIVKLAEVIAAAIVEVATDPKDREDIFSF